MFENITKFLKKLNKKDNKVANNSREAAKERLHLVLMQDRANVSADFLELMKQEIIEVIKKYIDVDENAIDVRLTNKENADGTNGAPALYANIPILNIKNEARKVQNESKEKVEEDKEVKEEKQEEQIEDVEKVDIDEEKQEEKQEEKEEKQNEEGQEGKEDDKINNGKEEKQIKKSNEKIERKKEKVKTEE